MRRVLSLYLPNFSTDRLSRCNPSAYPPDRALIIAYRDGNRRLVAVADTKARQLGLRPGQTLAHVRAMQPDLLVAEAEPAVDAAALATIAAGCLRRYSPLVALDPPRGLWLDVTGCAHRFGGEELLLADLMALLERSGYVAQAAIAGTTGAAYALAHYSDQMASCLPPGQEQAALASLPLAALRLSATMVSDLRQLGMESIGQLADMPRAPLARRFGLELLRRYDQALGDEHEPITPLQLPDVIKCQRSFAEPVASHDYLARLLPDMLAKLCQQLCETALGVRQLDVLADRVDNRILGLRIRTGQPTHDAKHLARLLLPRLPELDLGFGIDRLTLVASLTEPFTAAQAGFGQHSINLSELTDSLANRIGRRAVYQQTSMPSYVPERTVARTIKTSKATGVWPTKLIRPIILLNPPELVEAMALLPDHAPIQFTWRQKRIRIARADGPERIYGEWWQRKAEINAVRDYFRVEDEQGHRFWLFRRGDGQNAMTGSHEWFLHGFFG